MTLFAMRAALCVAALFIARTGVARGELSIRDMNGYITGRTVTAFPVETWKYPAMLAEDSRSYCEISGLDHLALYGIEDAGKRVGLGTASANLKLSSPDGKRGLFLTCRNDTHALSWPVTDDVSVNGSRNSGTFAGALFMGDPGRFSAGVSGGNRGWDRAGWLYAAQAVGRGPWGIRGWLGVSSAPDEWSLDAWFKSTLTALPAETRRTVVEGAASVPVRTFAEVSVHGSEGRLTAPDVSRDVSRDHSQVLDADTETWGVDVRENALSHGALRAGYDRYALAGDYELRFAGEEYAQFHSYVNGYRVWGGVRSARIPFRVREIEFSRISADLDVKRGRIDSWPFTPSQIDVVGDKTWTFYGTGRVVSNTVTLTWESGRLSSFSVSGGRAYMDYRFRIITRDYLSPNPLDLLFGRGRTETDRTRYADFALLYYAKEFRRNRASVFAEFQQIVPLRHVRKESGGGSPDENVFSNVEFKMPEYYGGLSLRITLRYFL